MKKISIALVFLMAVFMVGCDATMVVRGKVMGFADGKFIYQDGYTTTHYLADLEPVFDACRQALRDLDAKDIQSDQKITEGRIRALIGSERIDIKLAYLEKQRTSVGVRAGVTGSDIVAKMIHDRIAKNLQPRQKPE